MHGIKSQTSIMVLKNLPVSKYQDRNTKQTLIFVGYVKMRESSYAQFFTRINATVNHIDTRITLSRFEGSSMIYTHTVYGPE